MSGDQGGGGFGVVHFAVQVPVHDQAPPNGARGDRPLGLAPGAVGVYLLTAGAVEDVAPPTVLVRGEVFTVLPRGVSLLPAADEDDDHDCVEATVPPGPSFKSTFLSTAPVKLELQAQPHF